jgi:hypothetical protein
MRRLLALAVMISLISLGCSPSSTKSTKTSKPPAQASKPASSPASTPASAPAAEGKIALGELKAVEVEKKKDADITVTIKRTDYKGPITVTFKSEDAKDITIAEIKIDKDADDGKGAIKVGDKPEGGTFKVTATPTAEDTKVKPAEGELKVTVKK